jgi:hypothetical protein
MYFVLSACKDENFDVPDISATCDEQAANVKMQIIEKILKLFFLVLITGILFI